MFTQACLIRDYNKDLISKIENIGYRNYGNPFQFTDFNILYTTIDGYYVPYKVQVDSSWIVCGDDYKLMYGQSVCEDDMKAFNLKDVIELLPIENIDIRRNCHERWVISYKDEITFKSEFMIDAAYEMLIWVLENNYLKTK